MGNVPFAVFFRTILSHSVSCLLLYDNESFDYCLEFLFVCTIIYFSFSFCSQNVKSIDFSLYSRMNTQQTWHVLEIISNGNSPANLANSSTRQKFAVFLWLVPANLVSIERIFVTRAGEFVEYWANLANLANLASLANLARVD